MTGRPDAGPGAGEPDARTPPDTPTGATDTTRRICIDTDATPAQLRHAARMLREREEALRYLTAGHRALDGVDGHTQAHEWSAKAYDRAAAALEALGDTPTRREP